MEEYIRKLLEQVRFKEAHKSIEGEMRSHIEDQIGDNMSAGMDREEAEKAAVADMGDPVEVGIAMDRVHRPRIAWSVVVIAVLIGIASSIVHELVVFDASAHDIQNSVVGSHVFYTKVLAGLVLMLLIYLIDYTTIAKYSKIIAICLFALLIMEQLGFTMNGVRYFGIGHVGVMTASIVVLYVPLFGAILYKYKGGGWLSIIASALWMIIPVFFVTGFLTSEVKLVMMFSMALQLSIAVYKGWFKVPRIRTIISLWAMITVIPFAILALAYKAGYIDEYYMIRIRAFLFMDSDYAYTTKVVRSFNVVELFGGSGKEILGYLPNPNGDYLFLYIANKYGLIAAQAMVVAVLVIIIMGFMASMKSKNQLGLVIGAGCMNVLLLNLVVNCLENAGIMPASYTYLPFFSAGAGNILVAYAFLGIILSIYKYKDAYPQHIDIGVRGRLKLGNIEIMKN